MAGNAVEFNSQDASQSVNYLEELSKAYEKSESLDPIHEKYARISQEEFEKILAVNQSLVFGMSETLAPSE